MKIGLLHYTAPPVVGGVEAILATHSRLMKEAGHSVCVIAGRGGSLDPGVQFHHLPHVDSLQEEVLLLKRELDSGKVSSKFDSLVEKIALSMDPLLQDLDLLIAHNVCSLHKNLALTAVLRNYTDRLDRAALILWHHDFAWTSARYRSELYDGYPWDLIREPWPRATNVVVSNFRRKEMSDLFKMPLERIQMIPNGFDLSLLLGLGAETMKLEMRWKLTSASPLILLPVRITERKNIELAICTIGALRPSFPRAMLIVTGPPGPHNLANQEYFARLKKLRDELSLQNMVFFAAEFTDDYLPDEVIFSLYRLADLLLLTSYEEGFGLPIIEASQIRLPFFCTDIPAFRELGMKQANYFSVTAAPEKIAAQIEEYLNTNNVYQLRTRLRDHEWMRIYKDRIEPLLSDAIKVTDGKTQI